MPTRKRRIKQAAIVNAFAERLRAVRLARGMTQKNLADKAHVTLSYVSKLESGGAAPGLDLLDRIAVALGVRVVDLLPTEAVELDEQRRAVKERFDLLIVRSGAHTLSMLNSLLIRIADSPDVVR
jgi:transcriptional regulator with XRE-family HTH domain